MGAVSQTTQLSSLMTDSIALSELPYAYGQPQIQGQLRTAPEDFQVRETLGFSLEGSGEHVWLWVRKRNANTEWVARQLAKLAGTPTSAVGYAGLKDRHAVTEQWFSVQLPGRPEPDWSAIDDPDMTVLEVMRHSRKLRRGALTGNAFRIVVRKLQGDGAELTERLKRLAVSGVPNYFGEQRFGQGGGNLVRAEAMLSGKEKVRDRHQHGLYLSAARSALFNAVLARRVADQSWDRPLSGEVLMLAGSHSIFTAAEPDETIHRRVTEGDLHPTGPLWGAGELLATGAVRALEQAVAETLPIFRDGLEAAGLRQERRALRLLIGELALEFPHPDTAILSFHLPAGAYATVVLRELIGAAA